MDEQILPDRTRRAGVVSFPIQLADGNLWGLAVPRPRLRSRVTLGVDALGRPTETIDLSTEFGYPLEIRRLIEHLSDACELGTAECQHEALFRLAAALLGRAHELEPVQIARLFEMDLEDLPGFVDVVSSVVTGDYLESYQSPRKRDADD